MIPYAAYKNILLFTSSQINNIDIFDIYKFGSLCLMVFISYYSFETIINFELTSLDIRYYEYLKWNHRVDKSSPLKEDMIEASKQYVQNIKINRFLADEKNLEKTINFFRYSTRLHLNLKRILQDKYRHIFIDCQTFYNYYGGKDECPVNYIKNECENVVCINLREIYEEEQMINGINIFDIHNNDKYYPLKKGDLCFMTNYAKLNVIKWIIEIGIYDYIEKHYM